MSIRIVRNESANCITFRGTSVPAYFNACLSGVVNPQNTDLVNIRNDIRSADQENDFFEFSNIHYTEFEDRDGNTFNNAQEVADYITAQGNVLGLNEVGKDLTGTTVNFRLDQTSTSIIMDNGEAFGVNTIKAIPDGGLIKIKSIGEGIPIGSDEPTDRIHFENLDHTLVKVNGSFVSGGLNDVVDTLNELFTVGAFESVVIRDPYSTMVADVNGVDDSGALVGTAVVDPIGNDVGANTTTHNNNAGYLSSETINQAGEYFTFDIRGEGQIGFGLVHTQDSYDDGYFSGNSTYANPVSFCNGVNSSHYGYQFSHFFHPTPNGSWTNYGANTAYSMRSGWSSFPDRQNWLDGNPVKIRVGIDTNGYISIDSYDPNTSTFVPHSRTTYIIPDGAEFKLGIKFSNPSARLYSTPKVHLLEEQAPTMYFRYIESPDGNFDYPIFATEDEANYYDLQNGGTGTGTSTTATYPDDPTNTTWFIPTNGFNNDQTSQPIGEVFLGNNVNYTEITSLTNADLAPPLFTQSDLTYQEGSVLNLQVTPAGATWSTSASISPSGSGLVFDGSSMFQGTLSDVTSDTVYTVTVTRANSYGSTTGSFNLTVTDAPPVQTNDTPWNKALDFSGSSEYATQVHSGNSYSPMKQTHTSQATSGVFGNTSTSSTARPWMCATVFKIDAHNSNQHIWNMGEGASGSDDNIYLRLDANQNLYFGWGRSGALNECRIATSISSMFWYGVSIAYSGHRYGTGGSTAGNLYQMFDIRLMSSHNGTWDEITDVGTYNDWNSSASTTGGRMDRQVVGDLTIGGRGANRSFHGKVASMVVTTLKQGQAMPNDAEHELMITDPKKWMNDYKVGQTYRRPTYSTNSSNWQIANTANYHEPANTTQVWLMGDGTNDSYSNMIRNQVNPGDQNATKLNMLAMVSNDIQTVNINGLT